MGVGQVQKSAQKQALPAGKGPKSGTSKRRTDNGQALAWAV
jgi:hypothetical protein